MGKPLSNEELVNKAVIATDALAAGGKLNNVQANKFIDYVYDVSSLKGKVRQVRFNPENMDIDKINVGSRVAVAASEGVDPGTRRGVQTAKITLTPKEIMVPFEITDDFGQYNIEEGAVEDHIIKMMATQLGNDMEEGCIDGDSLGPSRFEGDLFVGGSTTQVLKDSYVGLFDGWLKKARAANVVDAAGANISPAIFNNMLNAMPEKYKRNKSMLKFFSPTNIEQNFRSVVGTRATNDGDKALSSQMNLTPYGIELVGVPLLSSTPRVTEHKTLSGTTAAQLLFKNIVDGSETVTLSTLGSTLVTPFVEGVDYTMDYTNGTIVRIGTGSIGDGASIKITYQAESMLILTEYRNLIMAIGRDIRIEKDRNIYKRVNEYAITAKITCEIENLEAVVFAKNVGLGVS